MPNTLSFRTTQKYETNKTTKYLLATILLSNSHPSFHLGTALIRFNPKNLSTSHTTVKYQPLKLRIN